MAKRKLLPVGPDFYVANHGSIVILHALTSAAQEWVDDNLPDDRLTWGTDGTVIEPRYVNDIVEGFIEAGLTL